MPLFGLFTPPDIVKLKAKANVPGLIKALSYKKDMHVDSRSKDKVRRKYAQYSAVRQAAATALGQIGDLSAVGPLLTALKGDNTDVLKAAAQSLGQIGDVRAVEPLLDVSAYRQSDTRQVAERALAQIGSVAVGPLLEALKNSAGERQQAAARVLVQIKDPQLVDWLIDALKQPSDDRLTFARMLGEIGDARAVEPLVATLGDNDLWLRQTAAEALSQLGWEPADDKQRALNAIALKKWDEVERLGAAALEPLLARVGDKDKQVRRAAARTLGRLKDSRAVAPLSIAVQDQDMGMRQAAANALGEIGDPGAIEPLITTCRYHDDSGRAAADALVQIGSPAVAQLVAALARDESRSRAAWALGEIGDARAIEPLTAILHDPKVRATVVRALESLGWQPVNDTQRAICAAVHYKWDELASLGLAVVEPLTVLLQQHRYDTESCAKAAQILATALDRKVGELATPDLRAITQLEDITRLVSVENSCGVTIGERDVTDLDYSYLRQLARQELIRRGLEA
jgi:HEAT repeat protein